MYDTTLDVQCKYCKKSYPVSFNSQDLLDWKNKKKYIQNCLGYLSAGQRELLMTQTCDNCWEDMFGECDGEDE